jgi:transmembrane 9 superfamily protein 2/4
MLKLAAGLAVACSLLLGASAYYLPGTYPREFSYGQHVQADVNSLISPETELPFDYYSLPFCWPPEGIRSSLGSINPGTILMGSRIENSPYNFTMKVDEKTKTVCKPAGYAQALTEDESEDMKTKIEQRYRVRLILDNLPITTYDLERGPESVRPGFDLGFWANDRHFVNNHLMFKVLVYKTNGQYTRARKRFEEMEAASVVEGGARKLQGAESLDGVSAPSVDGRQLKALWGKKHPPPPPPRVTGKETPMYMVVGFEVVPCSIHRNPGGRLEDIPCPMSPDDPDAPKPMEVTKGAKITYTYDVFWEESTIAWSSRWDAYLKMPGGRVHWFSILNSMMVVVVMSCIVAMIMMRTIRKDLAQYEALIVDSGGQQADIEESGWKMLSGDVFRTPKDPLLLCVEVGSGVQICTSAFITLLFAALGFLSPASRGALLTALLVMYLLLAIAAGYAAVYLWGLINRSYEGWYNVCWRVSCYFPGVSLGVLTVLNLLIWHTGSSGAIPLGAFFSLVSLWFIVSIPLCYSGGLLAARQEVKQYPTRTNQIPRHIPPPHWASHPAVLFLAAGLLPFGTIFVELYFAMTSIWQGYFYYIFGFLFLVGILTTVITIEVSIVCTYVQLCAEDYLWWWRSFIRGGSVAFYIFLYSLGFLFNTLHLLSGTLSIMLYLTYTAVMVWGIYLGFGTIGFLCSLWFTYMIYDSVKAD